jgi:cytosine/adenosine deaminase-related metal-dependent hydrolase
MELTCRDVLEFATIEGARACGLEDRVGSLTPGKRGDLILIRTDSFGMTPLNNPVGQVVYNAHPGLVDTVIVDGRVVKRAGALEHVDAGGVRQLAIDSRDDILGRADARSGARIGGSWIPAPYEVVEATA